MSVAWIIAAIIMAITIIGLPWTRAAFHIALYTLLPFGQTAVSRAEYSGIEDSGTGPLGFLGRTFFRHSHQRESELSIELTAGTCRMNNRMGRLLLCLVLLALSTRCALADDELVWAALKQGGKVILLRHTHVDIREGIGHLAPGNCAEEVNLSASGMEQAKGIGEAFRAHGITVGEVFGQSLLPLH